MLNVRAMLPTDVEKVISIHKEAFAGTVGASVGDIYIEAVIKWFVEYPQSIALTCERDGQIVGYAYGAPQGYSQFLNRDLLMVITYAVATHPLILFRSELLRQIPKRMGSLLGRRLSGNKTDIRDQSIYRLVAIGVASKSRAQGVGRSIVNAFERTAWDRKADEVQLSVYTDNTPARALYEACGWRIMSEHPGILQYNRRKLEETLSKKP